MARKKKSIGQVTRAEAKTAKAIIKELVVHFMANVDSIIVRYFGLYEVRSREWSALGTHRKLFWHLAVLYAPFTLVSSGRASSRQRPLESGLSCA